MAAEADAAAVGVVAAVVADKAAANRILPELGVGVGWRPELALAIDRYPRLGFVELLAENFDPEYALPAAVEVLRSRGCKVVPHGLSLSLGGAERPGRERLARLERLVRATDAPLISEHLAFVRAAGQEAGHLLPVPLTREALSVVCENVRAAQSRLSVPLALENIAALFQWPDAELHEADFLAEVVERTGTFLLLDLSNLYANACNHGWDTAAYLRRLPLESVAYVHVSGGVIRGGRYHDTHAAPVREEVLDLLAWVCGRAEVPGVLLERDDSFPPSAELHAELAAIARCWDGSAKQGEGS